MTGLWNNDITIPFYMVKDLKLSGNELLVYALLFGDGSTDEKDVNDGYFKDRLGLEKEETVNVLKSLRLKGLISCRVRKDSVWGLCFKILNPSAFKLSGFTDIGGND